MIQKRQRMEYVMTLSKLAELAGVSVSTVSKAFSDRPDVGRETKERIFALAKAHGCFDRYNKNKFEKRMIAVLCPEIISEYYSAMVNCLMAHIEAHGGLMTLGVTNFDEARERELYTYYSSYCKADGIIVVGSCSPMRNEALVPTVTIGAKQAWCGMENLSVEEEGAMMDAISHLKLLGHRRIGFVGEELTMGKLELFKGCMRQLGLPVHARYLGVSKERFEQGGADIVRGWLQREDMPTAIVAAYDYMAIGAIKELRNQGYLVPQDVSVIGMDDITLAPYLETSLSSICYPKEELCREAVALIMSKNDNQHFRVRQSVKVAMRFIPRGSTGDVCASRLQGQ